MEKNKPCKCDTVRGGSRGWGGSICFLDCGWDGQRRGQARYRWFLAENAENDKATEDAERCRRNLHPSEGAGYANWRSLWLRGPARRPRFASRKRRGTTTEGFISRHPAAGAPARHRSRLPRGRSSRGRNRRQSPGPSHPGCGWRTKRYTRFGETASVGAFPVLQPTRYSAHDPYNDDAPFGKPA